MPLVIRLPTPEEKDRALRFQVHHFYVLSIVDYLTDRYACFSTSILQNVIAEQKGLAGIQRIQRRSDVDQQALSQYLCLGWASELQLRLANLSEPVLLRYSNAWAPIHAYYAVYMAAQAWFVAMGHREVVDNHTGSLNTIANQVAARNLFPLPWSVTCSGCPQTSNATYHGLPHGVDPAVPCEVLSRPDPETFWPRYCTLLRTTRERRLVRNFDEWKRRNGRHKMYAKEKDDVAKKLAPTTAFDFFWRLRVRSNYRDVRAFLMSGVDDEWQEEFFRALLAFTDATCGVLHLLTVRYAGNDAYQAALDDFLGAQRTRVREIFDPFMQSKREAIT